MSAVVVTRVVRDVVHHLRFRLSEWICASILATFSARLLGEGCTFCAAKSYDYMASWATEAEWGAVIGVIAALRLLALAINGTFTRFRPYSPFVRSFTAWLSGAVWFSLFVGFYVSNPNATGWSTYLVLLIADTGLSVAIAVEAGQTWRQRRRAPS